MAKTKLSVGDEVRIEFLDHGHNAKDSLLFKVYGEITEITQTAYKVLSWGYVNDVDRAADSNTDNEDWFIIVKKAVQSIKVFK